MGTTRLPPVRFQPIGRSVDLVLQHLKLRALAREVSLHPVKRGTIALLGLLLALHVVIGCGVAQAGAVIEGSCCGANCPLPSSAGDRTCCQVENAEAPVEAFSARCSVPPLLPFVGLIQSHVVILAPNAGERVSVFQYGPPGAVKLALLCSRQI